VGKSESLVMKTWPKILVTVAIGGCLLARGTPLFANTTDDAVAGEIQAIHQASDPSAAIAAYANGIATDRNNPRIYEAYIGKMVELGLPEMAYHQAESLTGLESNNGLAWGVVAYVDARRGQMAEALSAVVLAGQFAPDNPFVQRTAGELTAWYDLKADKTTFSDSTKDAVAKLRVSLDKRTAFAEAYTTASKAYQSPATTAPPAQSSISPNPAPAQQQAYSADTAAGYNSPPYPYDPGYNGPQPYPYDYAAYPPPYDYYPDYGPYYWGAGWIAPSAWWWWPVGCFGGCSFFPCSSFVVFDHHHGIFHDGHSHDGFHSHNGSHDGFVAHNNGSFHTTHNGGHFFGSHASPNFAAHSGSDAAHFHGASAPGVLGTTPRTAVNTRVGSATGTRSTSFGANSTARMSGSRNFAGTTTGSRMSTPTAGSTRFGSMPGVTTRTWSGSSGVGSRTWNSSAFANRTWNTTTLNSRAWAPAHQSWASQSFGSRSFAVPQTHSFANMGGFQGGGMGGSFRGGAVGSGSFHGGGGMGGGSFHGGGGMGGGSFHGGGGTGGGHGGGGHR
jgi:hypothetical protein